MAKSDENTKHLRDLLDHIIWLKSNIEYIREYTKKCIEKQKNLISIKHALTVIICYFTLYCIYTYIVVIVFMNLHVCFVL